MNPSDYTPGDYWDERLSRDYSLRGTGHISYSGAYNRWLYRRKGDVLLRALRLAKPRGTEALDVGSGTGWVVERLTAFGFGVHGCDVAPVAVERLGERFGPERFSIAAIGTDRLPGDDGTYDAITLMDVLYHVTDDERWQSALGEIARVLAPGGAAIVTDSFASNGERPASHVRFRSEVEWRSGSAKAGLEITELLPLYAWLSRDRDVRGMHRLPDRARGPLEYVLERIAPRTPHMRCAVIRHVGAD